MSLEFTVFVPCNFCSISGKIQTIFGVSSMWEPCLSLWTKVSGRRCSLQNEQILIVIGENAWNRYKITKLHFYSSHSYKRPFMPAASIVGICSNIYHRFFHIPCLKGFLFLDAEKCLHVGYRQLYAVFVVKRMKQVVELHISQYKHQIRLTVYILSVIYDHMSALELPDQQLYTCMHPGFFLNHGKLQGPFTSQIPMLPP